MKDKLLDVKDWMIDNKSKLTTGLLIVGVLGVVIFSLLNNKSSDNTVNVSQQIDSKTGIAKENTPYQMQKLKEGSDELREVFSILETDLGETPTKDGKYLKQVLYLKKPFIKDEEFKQRLKEYVEMLKIKYNDEKNGSYLKGITLKVYDREVAYSKGADPRATAYYMLKVSTTLDQIQKENPNDSWMTEQGVMTTWEKTLETQLKSNADYLEKGYELRVMDFAPMKTDSSVVPLSDEEFAFYQKLQMYKAITGGMSSAVNLYLQWDLGKAPTTQGVYGVTKEFERFFERQSKLNGQMELFRRPDLLKIDLAVARPQFLLYATKGVLKEDPLEAQKELIKSNKELYQVPIEEDVNRKAEAIGDDSIVLDDDVYTRFDPSTGISSEITLDTIKRIDEKQTDTSKELESSEESK